MVIMGLAEIVRLLSSEAQLVSAKDAEKLVPDQPGLYSVFIDDSAILPAPFSEYLSKKGSLLIYLGKASTSLQSRLVAQDLRHKGASTFFRGLGAVLEYRPSSGARSSGRGRRR